MALDTYANLQTAVALWLARPGDTLITPSIPDMITLFESEAERRLFTRFNETSVNLATVAGTPTVALPATFVELRSIKLLALPNVKLVYVTPEEMDSTWIGSQQDQSIAYTIEGTNLRLAPTPASVYTIVIGYMAGLPALSVSNTTNWLLTNYPDAYLFGTLVEASAFIMEDERAAGWMARRDRVLDAISLADRKARWGGGSLQIKTDVGNP